MPSLRQKIEGAGRVRTGASSRFRDETCCCDDFTCTWLTENLANVRAEVDFGPQFWSVSEVYPYVGCTACDDAAGIVLFDFAPEHATSFTWQMEHPDGCVSWRLELYCPSDPPIRRFMRVHAINAFGFGPYTREYYTSLPAQTSLQPGAVIEVPYRSSYGWANCLLVPGITDSAYVTIYIQP